MDATGQVRVAGSFAGSKTNDNAAPSTDLMPVVGAIASSSAQSYTNGRLVLPRVNLFGAQPVFFTDPTTGSALTAATDATYGTTTYAEGTSSGPVVGAIRNDTLEALANTNNEAAPLQVDALGLLYARMLDPCSGVAKQYLPINISTATTTEITASLSGASNYYYVCSINLGPTAGAQNIALVDDDTDNCASVTSGVAGGTTAGTGWNAAANGGLTFGNGGSSIARTNGLNRVLCLVTSAAVQVSGVITVVAAP